MTLSHSLLIVTLTLFATANWSFCEMRSPAAEKAKSDYKRALLDAEKQYVAALKAARDSAMVAKDLAEANAIDAEIKQHVANAQPKDVSFERAAVTDLDLINVKAEYHTFSDALLTFRSDGTVECSRKDFKGEKFWQLDSGILKLYGPTKTTLASEYVPLRQGNMIFWLGRMTARGEARLIVQQRD